MSAARPLVNPGPNNTKKKRGRALKDRQNKITSYFSPDKDEPAAPKINGIHHMTNGFHSEDSVGETKHVVNGLLVPSVRTRSQAQKIHQNGLCQTTEEALRPLAELNGMTINVPPVGSSPRDLSPAKCSSPGGSGPTTPHKIQAPNEARLRLDAPISPSTFNKLKIVSPKKLNFSADAKVPKASKPNGVLPSDSTKAVKNIAAETAAKPSNNALKSGAKPAMKNTQMTQYFPIRRSHRKSKSKLLLEKQKQIEEKILSGKEVDLKIEVFPEKGRGIVTTRPFKKGEMVVEYLGNLMEVKEAKDKEMKYALDSSKGCYMYYFTFHNVQYCIDATEESPYLGRLVNHSRNGNLVPKAVEVKGKVHLILMAKKDIPEGTEILYDYGDRSKQALEHHPWLAY